MLGTVIGPPMAGWSSQHLSWRWIFWINLPLLAIGLILILFAVAESRDEGASHAIDWFGVPVPSIGVFSLLFALQSASGDGWSSPIVVLTLVAAPILLALFVLLEPPRREPLFDFGLFSSRAYWAASGVAFAGNVAFAAVLFLTPMYLQVALGFSPLRSGTVLLAISIPCFVFSLAAGPVCSRFGTRWAMVVGMVLITGGCAAFAAVNPGSGLTLVIPVLAITGTGLAGAFNGSNIAGVAAVPEAKAGAGAGVLSQVRLVGRALGVAVALVVFDVAAERRLDALIPGSGLTSAQLRDVHGVLGGSAAARRSLARDAPSVAGSLEAVVRDVFVGGLRWAMVVIATVSLLGTVSAWFARGRPRAVDLEGAPPSTEVDALTT